MLTKQEAKDIIIDKLPEANVFLFTDRLLRLANVILDDKELAKGWGSE